MVAEQRRAVAGIAQHDMQQDLPAKAAPAAAAIRASA
jgi:hypothetical protein